MKIGIIGTGVISSAIVEGIFLKNDLGHEVYLSPRNKEIGARLSEKFEDAKVCSSNQEVIDNSEWIILSVLPSVAKEVISQLKFSVSHKVINLISDKSLSEINSWTGEVKSLVHVVPLSFIANRRGPIAIYPKEQDTMKLFSSLGDVISVDSVEQIRSIAAITGLMTSYYALLWDVVKWSESKGLTNEEAIKYTSSFFEALSGYSKIGDLEKLSSEMTPGGFNEMALKKITDNKGLELWTDSLDNIMKRFD